MTLRRIGKPQTPAPATEQPQGQQQHQQQEQQQGLQDQQRPQAFTSPLFVGATTTAAPGPASPDEVRLHVHPEPLARLDHTAPLGAHAGDPLGTGSEGPGGGAGAGRGEAQKQQQQRGPLALGALREEDDTAGEEDGTGGDVGVGEAEAGGSKAQQRLYAKRGGKAGAEGGSSAAAASLGPLAAGAGAPGPLGYSASVVPTNISQLGSDFSDSDGWDVDEEITELPRWWGNVKYQYYRRDAAVPSVPGVVANVASSKRRAKSAIAMLSSAMTMPQPPVAPGSARAAAAKLVPFNSMPAEVSRLVAFNSLPAEVSWEQGAGSAGGASTPMAGGGGGSAGIAAYAAGAGAESAGIAASAAGQGAGSAGGTTPLASVVSVGGAVAEAASGQLPTQASTDTGSGAGGSTGRLGSLAASLEQSMQVPEHQVRGGWAAGAPAVQGGWV